MTAGLAEPAPAVRQACRAVSSDEALDEKFPGLLAVWQRDRALAEFSLGIQAVDVVVHGRPVAIVGWREAVKLDAHGLERALDEPPRLHGKLRWRRAEAGGRRGDKSLAVVTTRRHHQPPARRGAVPHLP